MTDLTPEVLARWENLAEECMALGIDTADRAGMALETALSGVRSRDARIAELEQEVAARDAGIAGAVAQLRYGLASQAERILSSAPSSALAARDARVRAEALEEAAAIADGWSDQLHRDSTSQDDDYSIFADEIANQIRARAAEYREEVS